MIISDLTDQYLKFIIDDSSPENYFNIHPELFEHYFSIWSDKNIPLSTLNKIQISNSKNLIIKQLELIEKEFSKNNISLENYEIILFVGVGTTNGHAFFDDNQFKIWIPIESYTTELYTKVFLTHEIIHAVHYTSSPSFYFDSLDEKNHIGRQLITEGIATYLTHKLLGLTQAESLWADHLTKEQFNSWASSCQKNMEKLKNIVSDNFDSVNHGLEIFYANDSDDIFKFRSGYYLGYKLIEEIIEKQNLCYEALMKINKKEMFLFAREYLQN